MARKFRVSSAPRRCGRRIVIYGESGTGKSTLASLAPNALFLDVEDSTKDIEGVKRVEGIESFADVLEAVRDESLTSDYRYIVIDTATVLFGLMVRDHVLETIPKANGGKAESIEHYEWGKGFVHIQDACMDAMASFDRIVEKGKSIVLLAHATTATVPNPNGDDYLQFQPDIIDNGRSCRVRSRLVGWADEVWFLEIEKTVESGRAKGAGTRNLCLAAKPHFVAKSRALGDVDELFIPKGDDGGLWSMIDGGGTNES